MNLNYTGGFPAFFAGCPLPGPPLTPRAGWLIRLITRDQCKTGDQARSCINLVPTVSWVSEPVGPLEVLRQWYDWRWFLCCAARKWDKQESGGRWES